MKQPANFFTSRHPALLAALLVPCFLLLQGFAESQAAPPKRCLSSVDCPNNTPCINRRCFQGLRLTLKSHKTSSYKLAVAPILVINTRASKAVHLASGIYNQVIANFKRLRGSFQLIPKRSFLEKAQHNGIELGTFRFNPWRRIGTNGLLKMGVKLNKSGKTILQFRFYDIDASSMAIRIDQPIKARHFRWHVHKLCDKIYKYLTGHSGIFATKIAYVKRNRKKGGKDIWVVDFDGSNRRRVVSNGHINIIPSWSPNGRYILFTSYMSGRPYLYQVEVATGKIQRLSHRRGTYTGAVFSPKGGQIAISWAPSNSGGSSDIYTMTSQGTKMRRLTKSWGIDTSPTWSPDGKMLAFVSERFAHPHIFLMNSDGSNQTRLTFKGDYNQEPRWSPRNNEIMFTARDEYLKYDLFVIRLVRNASGSMEPKYRRLTQNQGTNLEATWSPDGRFIMFVSTRYGERKLFMMNADGTHQRMFLRGVGNFETPAWSPGLPHPRVVAKWNPDSTSPSPKTRKTPAQRTTPRKRKAPKKQAKQAKQAKPAKKAKPAKQAKPVRKAPAVRRSQPSKQRLQPKKK